MSTSTISSTITDATGDPVVGARIVCRLVPAPAFRTSDGSEIDPVVETVTDSSGNWSLVLEETASISPSNTNYEVVEYLPSGPRKHTIQVGASDQSLFAALVTPPPAADGNTYLTQASADARYQQVGALGGAAADVAAAASNGVSASAARSDHVHKVPNGLITQAMLAASYRATFSGASAPSSPSEGDLWYETDTERLWAFDGTNWRLYGPPAGIRVSASRTSGDVTINSTSWMNVDTGMDLTLPAVAGDLVEVILHGSMAGITAGSDCLLDAMCVNSSAYFRAPNANASTKGYPSWMAYPGATAGNPPIIGMPARRVIQSGDISGGNVVVRLRAILTSATNQVINADVTNRLFWEARNLGPAV